MKIKFGVVLILLFLSGCGLFGNSPTSVVKQYIQLSENNKNIEALEKLYSERAKRELGAEKILVNILSSINMGTQYAAAGQNTPFLKPEETINGEFATVTFHINQGWAEKDDKNNRATVLMVKENGEWKIYDFGQSGEPNPNRNSIFASEISKAYTNFPDLMKTRLTGKTIVLEAQLREVGTPNENDTGSIILKTGYDDSSSRLILCNLTSGAKALYDKASQVENKPIKVKGTISSKPPSDAELFDAVFVLDNCTVQ